VADTHRDQRGADAAAERESRPAVSLDETPREDELPAAERFADDGPNPEQVFASTEIREMISEIWTNSRRSCGRRSCCAKCRGIDGRSRQEVGRHREHAKARLWRARHQLRSGWDGVCAG